MCLGIYFRVAYSFRIYRPTHGGCAVLTAAVNANSQQSFCFKQGMLSTLQTVTDRILAPMTLPSGVTFMNMLHA